MTHSFSQTVTLTCPQCRHEFPAEIWLIVDADERPDLLARTARGDLHHLPCPQCGHDGTVDAPLLVLRRQHPQTVLIFSPAERTTREQDKEHLNGLLNHLKEALGAEWQDAWLEKAQVAPRQLLPLALGNTDPKVREELQKRLLAALPPALREVMQLLQESGEEIRSEEDLQNLLARRPDLQERLEHALREAPPGVPPPSHETSMETEQNRAIADLFAEAGALGQTLLECLQVRSPQEHRAFLLAHPELLSEEGLNLLERWLAFEKRAEVAQKLRFFLQVHRRAREGGVEEAFTELQGGGEDKLSQRFQHLFALQERAANQPALWQEVLTGWQALISEAERNRQEWLAAGARGNLANTCLRLYEVTGNSQWADEAQMLFQTISQFFTREQYPQEWAITQHSLGTLFLDRYERSGDESHAATAQQHFQNALLEYTRDAAPSDWAMTQHSLGNLFLDRYERSGDESHAATAQQHFQNALLEYTRDAAPSHWATVQHSLGTLFARRYERSGDESHAATAQQHFQNALEVRTRDAAPSDWAMTQHSLGTLFARRYERSGDESHAATAEGYYKEVAQLAQKIALPAVFPFRAHAATARLNFRRGNWQKVLQFAQKIRAYLEELLAQQNEQSGSESWLAEAQGLSAQLAWALLQENSPNLQQVVEALEEGRAQLLREALQRQSTEIERLPALGFEEVYHRWKDALKEERRLQDLPLQKRETDWFEHRQTVRTRIQELASEIRQQVGKDHPEFRYFLRSLPFEEIQRQAAQAPLVYLAVTSRGGFALIVRACGEPQVVFLPSLTEAALHKQTGKYLSKYGQDHLWQEELDTLLDWLGKAVMSPLMPALEGEARAVLIPGGLLGILPLHAARLPQGGYALDHLTFTYAPSAQALYHAARRVNGKGEERLLAVDNPRGDLVYTPWEVRAVLRHFPQNHTHLQENQATLQAVQAVLLRASILHFSTHGHAGWGDSQQAGVALAGEETLSLRDLYSLHLEQAQVAVLSACETAIPGLKAPDEVLSLPAGWMLAGVPRVIGSLWSVDDPSTALLMTRFYDLWRGEGKSPADALREAQIWLRDTPPKELRTYCRNFPDRETGLAFHRYLSLRAGDIDFAHPYHWAGFASVGLP